VINRVPMLRTLAKTQ